MADLSSVCALHPILHLWCLAALAFALLAALMMQCLANYPPSPAPAPLWTSLNSCLAAHCTGNLPSADTGLCQGTVGMYKSALVQLNNKWVFWPDRLTPRPSLGCVPSATVCQGCKSVCNFACCCWLLNPTSNLCRVWGTLPCSVGMASMT